jgi:predicted permease
MTMYRVLLRLYPASFRDEYGGEMAALFERRLRDTHGPLGLMSVWISTVGEILWNAALVHWDILRSDVRYTGRTLARTPGFAMTAVAIVALGIGATTAAFSVTDFVLIRPLPFPEPDRLVTIWERVPGYARLELSAANYRDWKQASTSYESVGMWHPLDVNMIGAGEPTYVSGAAVSFDLFPTLRVKPLLGRLFDAKDDRANAPATLLLSYRFWQTHFGGDPNVLGRQVLLDSEGYTIIGVMPREFNFPRSTALLWTPLRFTEQNYVDRGDNWMYAVGRLRPGVTLEQARSEIDVIAARSRAQYPKENANVGGTVFYLSDSVSQQSRMLLFALCGAAACVLLIACANLANLLLARALHRRRELAVRAAMGAGRERLVRQLLTESLLLAIVGGALGVAVAQAAVPLLNRLVPQALPVAEAPAVDVRVLLFALATSAVTGIVFGLAPVLRVGDVDASGLREGSRAGGGQKERVRSTLVVAEIVASIVLLASAGLLMRALLAVQARDPGFRTEGVLTLETPLPIPQYGKVAVREDFYNRVLSEVRAYPGVVNAGLISYLPLGAMRGGIWPVSLDGRQVNRSDNQVAFLRYVTPGFLPTMGIRMLRGRNIADDDDAKHPFAAVVSESFVKRFWPNETPASAIGRHFNFAFADRVVVGVAGDVRFRGLERESEPQVYLSYKQVDDNAIVGYIPRALAVRTSTPPETLAPVIREIVRKVDPQLPVTEVATLAELVERDTGSRTAQLRVVGAFAAIAFVLAAIGIHGLLSFAVSQRFQEIGVRMALGAQAGDILGMIVRRALVLAAAGIIPGIALAYASGRSMQALLVGVPPSDIVTFAAVVALAIVMTVGGTVVPALRAVRVDPITALRSE